MASVPPWQYPSTTREGFASTLVSQTLKPVLHTDGPHSFWGGQNFPKLRTHQAQAQLPPSISFLASPEAQDCQSRKPLYYAFIRYFNVTPLGKGYIRIGRDAQIEMKYSLWKGIPQHLGDSLAGRLTLSWVAFVLAVNSSKDWPPAGGAVHHRG